MNSFLISSQFQLPKIKLIKNMNKRLVKKDPIIKFIYHAAVSYKPPVTLTYH